MRRAPKCGTILTSAFSIVYLQPGKEFDMARNQLLLLLFIILSFTVVPTAYAQQQFDITFQDVINALGPRSGQGLLWDIFLYAIFFLGLITMLLIPDKQLLASLLNIGVVALAVISKLLVGYPPGNPFISATDFPVLIFNAGMFVIPFIVAGLQRAVKGKPSKATIPAILMGLLGGGYFFLFWALEQRGAV
jgi:hypothetical protein